MPIQLIVIPEVNGDIGMPWQEDIGDDNYLGPDIVCITDEDPPCIIGELDMRDFTPTDPTPNMPPVHGWRLFSHIRRQPFS